MSTKYVESISVQGFLGRGEVHVAFDQGINFIIGLNGTGKTTLITLLKAALTCDSRTLRGLEFEEIIVNFVPRTGKSRPNLRVRKLPKAQPGRGVVEYQFRSSAKAEPIVVSSAADTGRSSLVTWNIFAPSHDEDEAEINPITAELPQSIWLPLHRGLLTQKATIGETFKNPIDQKISQITIETTKYLAALENNYSKRLEEFQQNYFLSLVNATLERIEISEQYDLDHERTSLEQIFSVFFKDNTRYRGSIEKHFDRAKKAIVTRKNGKPLYYNDFIAISDTIRLHKLVDLWNELQKEKDETFHPKTKFSGILNSLLVNKTFRFDERNQPSFNVNGKNIDITDLSSGEKQLFIMLGSSLVQENAPFVYLADEPELSLHIDWQRKLVANLKHLNPHAQIIFATHSPDIVAGNQRNVIRMEDVTSGGVRS